MESPDGTPASASPLRGAVVFAGVTLAGFLVYALTCYRVITWWDSAQYSLAAATLGVAGPPGSLLLTVLGFIAIHAAPHLLPAFALNLLAGLIAAATTGLAAFAALRLFRAADSDAPRPIPRPAVVAIAFVALTLAFGPTLWTYATRFTPYGLTALFTALILVALLRWWERRHSSRAMPALFLVAFLVGLDASVHRTNALLIPGIVAWVCIGDPRTVRSPRAWFASIGGLAAGLCFQLLLIPLAARSPTLNMENPSNLTRWWNYISLEQQGGGFLFQVFPRRAGFFSHQMRDVADALVATFAPTGGALGVVGTLPAVFAAFGFAALFRHKRRLATALATLFAGTVLSTVLYFNAPEHYFRPLDRHYLPCLVLFACLSAFGTGVAVGHVQQFRIRRAGLLAWAVVAGIALVSATRMRDGYASYNRSRNFFAHDYAANILGELPPNAILFTGGDNDTFPLRYLQVVEGVRPDVTVVNISLTNRGWYVRRLASGPGALPFSRSADELAALTPIPWTRREVALPPLPVPIAANGTDAANRAGSQDDTNPARASNPASTHTAAPQHAPPGTTAPGDSLRLTIAPTAGADLLVQDRIALDMLRANEWRRPVRMATTVFPRALPWLQEGAQLEGLARAIPAPPGGGVTTVDLPGNLRTRFVYRGYADTQVPIDATTRAMAQNYYAAFLRLASDGAQLRASGIRCVDLLDEMKAKLPFERLHPSDNYVSASERICR